MILFNCLVQNDPLGIAFELNTLQELREAVQFELDNLVQVLLLVVKDVQSLLSRVDNAIHGLLYHKALHF